jgi:hypothetical protein
LIAPHFDAPPHYYAATLIGFRYFISCFRSGRFFRPLISRCHASAAEFLQLFAFSFAAFCSFFSRHAAHFRRRQSFRRFFMPPPPCLPTPGADADSFSFHAIIFAIVCLPPFSLRHAAISITPLIGCRFRYAIEFSSPQLTLAFNISD